MYGAASCLPPLVPHPSDPAQAFKIFANGEQLREGGLTLEAALRAEHEKHEELTRQLTTCRARLTTCRAQLALRAEREELTRQHKNLRAEREKHEELTRHLTACRDLSRPSPTPEDAPATSEPRLRARSTDGGAPRLPPRSPLNWPRSPSPLDLAAQAALAAVELAAVHWDRALSLWGDAESTNGRRSASLADAVLADRHTTARRAGVLADEYASACSVRAFGPDGGAPRLQPPFLPPPATTLLGVQATFAAVELAAVHWDHALSLCWDAGSTDAHRADSQAAAALADRHTTACRTQLLHDQHAAACRRREHALAEQSPGVGGGADVSGARRGQRNTGGVRLPNTNGGARDGARLPYAGGGSGSGAGVGGARRGQRNTSGVRPPNACGARLPVTTNGARLADAGGDARCDQRSTDGSACGDARLPNTDGDALNGARLPSVKRLGRRRRQRARRHRDERPPDADGRPPDTDFDAAR